MKYNHTHRLLSQIFFFPQRDKVWLHKEDRLRGDLCFENDKQLIMDTMPLALALSTHIILSVCILYRMRS